MKKHVKKLFFSIRFKYLFIYTFIKYFDYYFYVAIAKIILNVIEQISTTALKNI